MFPRKIIAAALVSVLMTGCTTSGVSTHANAPDHAGARQQARHDEDGAIRTPRSQHVSLRGDRSEGHKAAGQEHFKNQNYGLAEENFRKAVEIRPDNSAAWLGLAASLDQLGRFDFADRAYEQLAQLERDNARVFNNMGYSYLLRGDYQKSRKYLNRAQELDPYLEEVQGNIHLLEKTIDG